MGAIACAVGCGPPPPLSPQEILRDRSPGDPLRATPGLRATAQATFGRTIARVESSEPAEGPRDLTRESVMDTLALVASTADDVGAVASDVSAAAEAVRSPAARVSTPAGSVEARVKLPIDKQAVAVKNGADAIAKAADVVATGAALALALGKLFGKDDEKLFVRIAAETRGIPYRATCTIKDEGDENMPRTSLSCAITRADAAPRVVWHLTLGTQHVTGAGIGGMVPASRGYLQPEPKTAGLAPLWFSRPDKSVPFIRRGYGDYASFAVQRDAIAVARMRVDGDTSGHVWLAESGVDAETRDATAVAIAVAALARWPEVKPPPEQTSK